MSNFVRITRPGYIMALFVLILGLAFLLTGSVRGMLLIAVLEGALWASLQYFKDRRECLKSW
jgi:uncharacterized membrane protein